MHRALLKLIEEGKVKKTGKAPRTYYSLAEEPVKKYQTPAHFDADKEEFLQKHFLLVTELGKRLTGTEAMNFWCERQKLPMEKTINEFIQTRKKYLQYYNQLGFIPGMEKLKTSGKVRNIGVSINAHQPDTALELIKTGLIDTIQLPSVNGGAIFFSTGADPATELKKAHEQFRPILERSEKA